MKLSSFEKILVATFVEDDELPQPVMRLDPDALEVEKRSMTGSGFITELADNAAARAFSNDTSFHWGERFVAIVNADEHVGMVAYVEAGRLAALEGYTFGGRAWPHEIERIRVRRV